MTGEEWIVKKTGAYLPGAYEEVVEIVDAYVLTDKVYYKSTIIGKSCMLCDQM